MKYIILIFCHFICTFASAQQITDKQGNDDFKVWLISFDTSKVKVYNGDKIKYDTIGPQLRIVSDTAHDHWNGVSAMYVYEVRIYKEVIRTHSGNRQDGMGLSYPEHFLWLDSKKKPFTLKVWTNE